MVPLNDQARAAAVAAFADSITHASTSAEQLLALHRALEAYEAANPERWRSVAEDVPPPLSPSGRSSREVWASWSGCAFAPMDRAEGVARYVPGLGWYVDGGSGHDWNVTHWKPLPKGPTL